MSVLFLEIALNSPCVAGQSADQCTDSLAECSSGLTCECKAVNFEHTSGACAASKIVWKTDKFDYVFCTFGQIVLDPHVFSSFFI